MYKGIFTIAILFVAITFVNAQTVTKKVLLEEFSTAPCGFCPEGAIIAERIITEYPDVFTYTHHAGFGTDSMTISESKTIASKYTNSAPSAVIDRGDYPIPVYRSNNYLAISRQKWDSICVVRLNEPAEAEIKIVDISINEKGLLNANIEFRFLKEMNEDDYRMNIALIEDSLSGIGKGWDQKNYFNNNPNFPTLYKKGDSIVGYQHRHVLRALPTGTWGLTGVIPSQPEVDKKYEYQLKDFQIPAKWKIKDLKLMAFISVYNTDIYKHRIFNTDQQEIAGTVSVKENGYSENEEFIIRPNPITDLGYIDCNVRNIRKAEFELFNIHGEKIRDINQREISKDSNIYFYTSDLIPGLYFIKIKTEQNTIIKSFLKI